MKSLSGTPPHVLLDFDSPPKSKPVSSYSNRWRCFSFSKRSLLISLVFIAATFFIFQNALIWGAYYSLNSFLFGCSTQCSSPLSDKVLNREVDMVVCWVDGADPAWLEKKRATQRRYTDLLEDATAPRRFRNLDEVCYLFRSVKKHAPWIRHIYLVTDNQVPSCLNESATDWITVVDHSDLIPRDRLPVFSPNAIEAYLHKIPGLSEYFLYNNDDMLFANTLTLNDLFASDGRMKFCSEGLFGYLRLLPYPSVMSYTLGQRRTAQVLRSKFPSYTPFIAMHQSKLMSRSLLEITWQLFNDELELTASHPFRNDSDVFPFVLAQSYGIGSGIGVSDYTYESLFMMMRGTEDDKTSLTNILALEPKPKWLCINDDSQDDSSGDALKQFYHELFPEPQTWETPDWELFNIDGND